MILEAIWKSGALNDINALDWLPLNASCGDAPRVDFTVNHHQCSVAYWLADGIHKPLVCFVKTIPNATTCMLKHFVIVVKQRTR